MSDAAAVRRAHVWVTGRVQGVFFRGSCAEEAARLGIRGWIRNLPDGRVEAVFEGPRETVDEMLRWCEKGPPGAKVFRLAGKDEDPEDEQGFTVLR